LGCRLRIFDLIQRQVRDHQAFINVQIVRHPPV
jgi:hypothetical protein